MIQVSKGWKGWREINTVTYDPERSTIEEMVRILKRSGTYRGTAQEP